MILEWLKLLPDALKLEEGAAFLTGALADGKVFPAGFGVCPP